MNKAVKMKKILFFIIVLAALGGIVQGQEARSTSSDLESKTVYDLILTYQAVQVGGGELPGPLASLASAKINLHVGTETVGIVVEDGKISEVVKDGFKKPTTEIKTSRKYFNSILTSKKPLKRIKFGLRKGFIVKRDRGVRGKAKGKVLERTLEKIETKDPKVQKRISKKISNVARKSGKKFIIEGSRAGLKKTSIELGGGEGLADQNVEIVEFTGYKDEAPTGIKKMDLETGEENLGVYVKIEVDDTDEVLLKIAYSEEDLDYAMLDEDSLTIKWLDEESGKWHKLSEGRPKWVKGVGVNADENYVYAILEHASVYGVAGNVISIDKLEQQRGYEPAYFESPEEIEEIRKGEGRKGIIDRVLDFILGLVL
jgi:hypothetical protein